MRTPVWVGAHKAVLDCSFLYALKWSFISENGHFCRWGAHDSHSSTISISPSSHGLYVYPRDSELVAVTAYISRKVWDLAKDTALPSAFDAMSLVNGCMIE